MITGVGTDIVEVFRIEKSMQNERFLADYFTNAENDYFKLKKYNPQTVSASFAAKEAVSKALGTGFLGFSLKDIEILHDEKGKPYVNLYNNAKKLADGGIFNLSLSHTKDFAVAFAVLEKLS